MTCNILTEKLFFLGRTETEPIIDYARLSRKQSLRVVDISLIMQVALLFMSLMLHAFGEKYSSLWVEKSSFVPIITFDETGYARDRH